MAIDARISLAGIVPQTQSAQTVSNIFQSNLNNAQNRRINEQQAQQQAALQPFRETLLANQAGLSTAQQPALLQQAELAASPEQQQASFDEISNKIRTTAAQRLKPFLDANDVVGANAELDTAINTLTQKGVDQSLIEPLIRAKQSLQTPEGVAQLKQSTDSFLTPISSTVQSVSQREFNSNVASVKADPNLETVEGKAAAIKLGLEAKASSAAQIQIAKDPELTKAVAASEATIAGAKASAQEGEKLKQQRKHKPAITALVKLAEKEAAERGDTLNSLQRSKAALPGLLEAVGQLKELSALATSTFGGKVFDFAVKQTGFGSTKGATSRAKFIAIVNNQVLPLLKETFGAAFTAQEGEALKATMGDPDASPDEKMAQLDAFVAQKMRDIETRERQLSSTEELSTGEFVGFKVVR